MKNPSSITEASYVVCGTFFQTLFLGGFEFFVVVVIVIC